MMSERIKLTTLIYNDMADLFIVMDSAVVQDNNAARSRVWSQKRCLSVMVNERCTMHMISVHTNSVEIK